MLSIKLKAITIATAGTILPCLFAGAIVGSFFRASFWYWELGISALSFFYVCLDRIPVRLFEGAVRHLPLLQLLKYGYTSTDFRPELTEEMVRDEKEWRTITYNHFYGNDR